MNFFNIQSYYICEEIIEYKNTLFLLNYYQMINHQQKNIEQINLNQSLLINKLRGESRKMLKKYQIQNKIKPKTQSQKPTPIRNKYQTIDYQVKSSERKLYDPVKVKIKQNRVLRMTQSSCERDNHQSPDIPKFSEHFLAEKARQFISRIRKQKNYRQGKFLLKKKEQEKKHQNIRLKKLQQQNYKMSLSREIKIAHSMQNVLKHQERINSRLSVNIQKFASLDSQKYKTQDSERQKFDEELSLSLSRHKLNGQSYKVLSLQKKIKNLSTKLRQLCKQ